MDCIFCKIANGEIPAKLLHKDNELVAFQDIRPQAPVHILIIPVEHIESIMALNADPEVLIGKMILLAQQIAKQEKIAESGFRLVFNCGRDGGQDVFHLHLHLLGGRTMSWPPG
ncbi:MAG: histidine triad nucleotide-binding protein [bacterium]